MAVPPPWAATRPVAADAEPGIRVVEVGGIPMSALVAEVPQPRAVIVALHGGAVTPAYFDARAHPRLSLLRVGAALGFTVIAPERPGYGRSAAYADRMGAAASRVDLSYAAIDGLLVGRPRGAGTFLVAHSMGCVLAVQMAADERGRRLLGLEIAGIGRHPHRETMAFMGPLTRGDRTAAVAGSARTTLRHVLWTPPHLYPAGAGALLSVSASPRYEGDELRGWPQSLPELAARVRIPVRYSLGDHERVWSSGPAALADVASLFTASPRVLTAEQAEGGHNLSVGLSALAYHLKVLAFAEECAVGREHSSSLPPAELPTKPNEGRRRRRPG